MGYYFRVMNPIMEPRISQELADSMIALADALPAAITIFDSDLRVIAANERVRKLLKLKAKEELIGMPIREMSPNITEERLARYRQVIETGVMQVLVDEIDHPTAGKRLWQLQAVKVGAGLALVAEDVTEKDAYRQLADQNVLIRRLKQEIEELKART